jgi:hypothetical protein
MANSPVNRKVSTITLISDTTVQAAVSSSSVKFDVLREQVGVLRSTNLDGSAVISLYYDAPDGSVNNPATDDNGTEVTLTPSNPERIINVPGTYRAAVTTAASTQGIVFVQS